MASKHSIDIKEENFKTLDEFLMNRYSFYIDNELFTIIFFLPDLMLLVRGGGGGVLIASVLSSL